ncbi:ExeA family protein [Moraxella equi]|uniref:Predicted ATPase (AAA+ superfamily) n=1 Tax=Moraxella equi TaxID=60442 RepID=A0A378QQC4_9GAMM|nr:AAA family ATPase [Moraxella equi]OPH34988.1 transposase [Moraxella equi]STZ02871.1 Predicted ATPase (AAA+ superfamily) [Moraxella equi]
MSNKHWLDKYDLTQAKIAKALKVSPATINLIFNHGKYPKAGTNELYRRLCEYLNGQKVTQADIDTINKPQNKSNKPSKQEQTMLLRKQTLSHPAKRQFKLFTNIFTDNVREANQVYQNADIKEVREALWQTAKGNMSFVAVIGQSGAGKSTLRRELIDRLERQKENVIVIEPYVLATEDNDIKGKTLKSVHIAESILATLAPSVNAKRSPEARFRQVHNLLKESSKAGNHHVLIIEEAHSLPIPTLKHLKRFLELENGFTPLLSIVLIGQNELKNKLSENNEQVREVVQRCEIFELMPFDRNSLEEYLQHRSQSAGRELDEFIDESGLNAIAHRLGSSHKNKGADSLLYPLAVGNLLTGALNIASELGMPVVTGDLAKEV